MKARLLILLAALPLAVNAVRPAPQKEANTEPIVLFLQKYCGSCHEEPEKLDKLKVHDRVAASEMPPKEAKLRPSEQEKTVFLGVLANWLTAREKAQEAREGRA